MSNDRAGRRWRQAAAGVAGLMTVLGAGCANPGNDPAADRLAADAPRSESGATRAVAPAALGPGAATSAAPSCGGGAGAVLPPISGIPLGSVCEVDDWCWYNPSPAGAWWRSIAAAGPREVWVAGASSDALHYDGSSWSAAPTGLSLTESLWAAAADDVWAGGTAVGGGAAIVHGDGHSFATPIALPVGEVTDIWGSDSANVYAVGWGGVQHWDGSSWTEVPGVAGAAIAGSGADDIWVGNYDGVKHFDGIAWTSVPALQGKFVRDLTVTGRHDVWVAILTNGATEVQHYDGTTWNLSFATAMDFSISVWGIGARADNDVWLVGTHFGPPPDGTPFGYVAHFDGQAWTVGADTPASIFAVGILPYGDFGVGFGGRVAQLSETTATACADLTSGSSARLFSVWASAPNDVWAVGAGGTAVHFDGVRTSVVPTGVTAELIDVWGTGPGDVWAVGRGGTAIHYDGQSWRTVATGTALDLFAVFTAAPNDVWMGGANGTLLHYTGAVTLPGLVPGLDATASIYDIHGTAANDIWLSGDHLGGFVAHFNGLLWSMPQTLTTGAPFLRVWAVSPHDVWTATGPGWRGNFDYWHFDGASWTEHFQLPSAETWMFPAPTVQNGDSSALGSFAFGPAEVWAVGGFGELVRRAVP